MKRDNEALISSVLEEIKAFRRDLHMNPELSGEETQTKKKICAFLEKENIRYTVCPRNGGIVAVIGHGENAVGARADIDALPVTEKTGLAYASHTQGVMHACGHDVHTAIQLGAAKVLKAMENELPGTVKLFFQPAEETTGGANDMILDGCMENPRPKAVMGLHVDPRSPVGSVSLLPGKMNAAVVDLKLRVLGTSCHGAHPEQGVDSIVVAASIITALQTVASRFTSPTTPCVVTIGVINGGTKNNIVAGEVYMHGTIRALDDATATFLKKEVRLIAEGTAAAFGAKCEVTLTDDYPALVNDKNVTKLLGDMAEGILGRDNVIYLDEPSLGADDFAYFSRMAPSCYFNIGTAAPGAARQALHADDFAPDEGCMEVGVKMLVNGLLMLLEAKL